MREHTCIHCGDTVHVADENGETLIEGESPLEHHARTGHFHFREPKPTGCANCGHMWMYQGESAELPDRVTCPRCRGKVQPGVVPDPDD